MAKLFDNVGQTTATTGTGTITLASTAITDSTNGDYQTFTGAGAVAGDVVNYRIVTGGNKWENGTGTLGGTGPGFTLTRTVIQSWDGTTLGTTALTLAGTSNVYCVPFGKSGNTWNGQQIFNSGTLTTSTPFTFAQTWNAAVTFSGVEIDITDTGSLSNATSLPFQVNRDGSPLMLVTKFGVFQTVVYQVGTDINNPYMKMYGGSGLSLRAELPIAWGNGTPGGGEVGSVLDTYLLRDGQANTLAMKNSTASQTLRLYGSSTGGNDAYAQFQHSTGGNLTISTAKTGTGTAGDITLSPGSGSACVQTSGTGSGLVLVNNNSSDVRGGWAQFGFAMTAGGTIGFMNVNDVGGGVGGAIGAIDISFSRNAAGIVEINNGTAGTFRDLIARNVRTNPTTVASLTAASTAGAGARSFVTDATATTFATTVAGGGSNAVPVYSDGTNWKVG